MSKKLVIVFLSLLLLFTASCGNAKSLPANIPCEQILSAAKGAVTIPDAVSEYVKGQKDFDAYTLSLWADGAYTECAEYGLLADYAVFYSSDDTTFEISVLKAQSTDDADKLSKLFERRKKTLSSGSKAAYDPDFNKLIEDSKIIVDGQFVILLITPDNDAIISNIEKLKQ